MNTNALFKISYGLFVITAKEDNFDNGCIINTLQQVTDTPLRISVTINKVNKTAQMIKNTGVFNVSILSDDVPFDIFKHFGFQSGNEANKFAGFNSVERDKNDILYLTAYTNAFVSGKVVETIDLGTHYLFVADVVDAEILSDKPSVSYADYHAHIKPQPQTGKVKGYRCKICGYIYEGDPIPEDFICPLCKHGVADFEKIEEE